MDARDILLRRATLDDSELLFSWANDETTRKNSFHGDPIPWSDHVAWLERKLADPHCAIYVAAEGSTDVAVVRFDGAGEEVEVAVTLGPEHRGKRLAAPVLDAAVARVFAERPASRVRAFVKPSNAPSLRAFERAAFERVPSPRPDAICLVRRRAGP